MLPRPLQCWEANFRVTFSDPGNPVWTLPIFNIEGTAQTSTNEILQMFLNNIDWAWPRGFSMLNNIYGAYVRSAHTGKLSARQCKVCFVCVPLLLPFLCACLSSLQPCFRLCPLQYLTVLLFGLTTGNHTSPAHSWPGDVGCLKRAVSNHMWT